MTQSFNTRRTLAGFASIAFSATLALAQTPPNAPPGLDEPPIGPAPTQSPAGAPAGKPAGDLTSNRKAAGTTSDGVLSTRNQVPQGSISAKPGPKTLDSKAIAAAGGGQEFPSGPAPIVFEPPILNLGEMQADVPKTGKLVIRNVSDKPVTIAKAIPGCGCTTANAPKDPIPVGGSTEMEITLKPGPKQGIKLSKRVTFQIEGAAPIVLTVEGDVAAYVTVTPDVIEGKKDEAGSVANDGKLVVAAADGQAFKITGVNPPVVGDLTAESATEHIVHIDWAKWEEQGRAIKLTVATDHPKASAVSVMIKRPITVTGAPTAPAATPRATPAAPTSPLVVAARAGDAAKVKELIALSGTNINEVDADTGRTALHWASRENRGEIVEILIIAKADVNAQDRTGKGPLTLAAESGSADATRRLIAAGASVVARDQIGGTPLTWGCGLGSAETVKLLLDAGADASVVDVNGLTPLIWAAGIGKPETVELILAKKPELNVKDGVTGDTALMRAVRSGKPESVKMLIVAGADVNLPNKQGYSPVQLAALSGTADKVQMLLDAKADLNGTDGTGRTALDLAQRRTDEAGKKVAELLASRGATNAIPVPAPKPTGAP